MKTRTSTSSKKSLLLSLGASQPSWGWGMVWALLRYFDRWNSLPEGDMDLPEQDLRILPSETGRAERSTGGGRDSRRGYDLCHSVIHGIISGVLGDGTSEITHVCYLAGEVIPVVA